MWMHYIWIAFFPSLTLHAWKKTTIQPFCILLILLFYHFFSVHWNFFSLFYNRNMMGFVRCTATAEFLLFFRSSSSVDSNTHEKQFPIVNLHIPNMEWIWGPIPCIYMYMVHVPLPVYGMACIANNVSRALESFWRLQISQHQHTPSPSSSSLQCRVFVFFRC